MMLFYSLAYINLRNWIVLVLEITTDEKYEIVLMNTYFKDILIQMHVTVFYFCLLLEIKHEVVGCLLEFECQFCWQLMLQVLL
jgi:hypothetical protein